MTRSRVHSARLADFSLHARCLDATSSSDGRNSEDIPYAIDDALYLTVSDEMLLSMKRSSKETSVYVVLRAEREREREGGGSGKGEGEGGREGERSAADIL